MEGSRCRRALGTAEDEHILLGLASGSPLIQDIIS